MFELKDCNAFDAIRKNEQGHTVKEVVYLSLQRDKNNVIQSINISDKADKYMRKNCGYPKGFEHLEKFPIVYR